MADESRADRLDGTWLNIWRECPICLGMGTLANPVLVAIRFKETHKLALTKPEFEVLHCASQVPRTVMCESCNGTGQSPERLMWCEFERVMVERLGAGAAKKRFARPERVSGVGCGAQPPDPEDAVLDRLAIPPDKRADGEELAPQEPHDDRDQT